MAEILKSMELINHNKTWNIEIESEAKESEAAIIRTCFNHGKITEKIFQGTPYDRNKKYIQKVMAQLRKGYIYNNPSANAWEPCFHRFVDRPYTGFMPIAANKERSDFYLIRVKGDFEDEIIYHYDENGNLLDQNSLGAKRLTYRAHLNDDGSIILQERNFEIYNPHTKRFEAIDDGDIACTLNKKGDHSDVWNDIRVDYMGYDNPSCRGYFDIKNTENDEQIKKIFNEFTVQNAFCAFTLNRLVVHTDYGVLSLYKIKKSK